MDGIYRYRCNAGKQVGAMSLRFSFGLAFCLDLEHSIAAHFLIFLSFILAQIILLSIYLPTYPLCLLVFVVSGCLRLFGWTRVLEYGLSLLSKKEFRYSFFLCFLFACMFTSDK